MVATLPAHGVDGSRLADPARFAIGERLAGAYVVTRVLGEGGMSAVYEADDAHLRRFVAVKTAPPLPEGEAMLRREGQALAAVHHPGLPVVHGLGVHRGIPFLVMERLFGVPLAEHLAASPRGLPVAEAVAILGAVAEALDAVHRAGLAHRDVKPDNVMLCAGRVVLLDLGIVLPECEADAGFRCGTPRYMAPEAVIGEIAPGQAHLIDSYAFGAMAFELLAGRPPFDADSVVVTLEQQVATPPPSLAARRPDVPPGLVALIERCLAKQPLDRPGLDEVALALAAPTRARGTLPPPPRA